MHFGATLRMLRIDAGFSLRALAEAIGVSSAYLSRVENGHDAPPTADRLVAIARALGVTSTLLVDLANKVDPFVSRYLEAVPAAHFLLADIARRKLGPAQLARVKAFLDQEFPLGPTAAEPWRSPPLSALLTPERIICGLSCTELDDAVEVAASRLAHARSGWSARRVAGELLRREREAPTALGSKVLVPHAVADTVPRQAALVTLAPGLAMPTPDGEPIELVICVFGGPAGRSELELLAHVARMAQPSVIERLVAAREPGRLLTELTQLENAFG